MAEKPAPDFSMLLASSVHDIKNSLGMLLETLGEVIADADLTEPGERRRFAILQGESTRINNTLIALLGLYRLGQGQIKARSEQVFVRDFLEEQIASQQLLLDMRGLIATLHCDPEMDAWFDARLIEGVVSNILVNAAKYARKTITINASKPAGTLLIEICDDGPGYPAPLLQGAVSQSIDFSSGSTSLGLYFAESIAQLHGKAAQRGRIELANNSDGGGRFRLYLP